MQRKYLTLCFNFNTHFNMVFKGIKSSGLQM